MVSLRPVMWQNGKLPFYANAVLEIRPRPSVFMSHQFIYSFGGGGALGEDRMVHFRGAEKDYIILCIYVYIRVAYIATG